MVEYKYGFRSDSNDIFAVYKENGVTKLRVRDTHVELSEDTKNLVLELLEKTHTES